MVTCGRLYSWHLLFHGFQETSSSQHPTPALPYPTLPSQFLAV